jgi:AcrR family transcriptional regulator
VSQGVDIPPFEFGSYEEPSDPVTVAVLDAAHAEFLSFGIRRATLDSVAKRAKVGRMTLHRRFATKQELVDAVFERSNSRIVASIREVAAAQPTLTDALVESLALGVELVRGDSLIARLIETDPDAVIPYLAFDARALVRASTRYVVEEIESLNPAVDARAGRLAAEAIIRVCHSIILTPKAFDDLADGSLLREFLRTVVSGLIPDPAATDG